MEDRLFLSEHMVEVSDKERALINNVLNKYGLKPLSIFKVRSVYKVETERKTICLKKIRSGRQKIKNGNILVEELIGKGFFNVTRYIKTKDGSAYVTYKKYIFYATEWIDGLEVNLGNINEAINCMKLMAKFHIAARSIDKRRLRLKDNLKNWPKIYLDALRDLETFKIIIERKKLRNEFDLEYYKNIDNFYNRGMIALEVLNKSNYYKLSKMSYENKTICHDSFYYQNIIKKGNKYFLIDLDSIIVDLQINDVGKLIRRLMFKNEYKWDFNKARILIEAYSEVQKLSREELEVMLSLIIFPHKFWKLGRKRYIKLKSWSESKYGHKLSKLISYSDEQQKFMDAYMRYLELLD